MTEENFKKATEVSKKMDFCRSALKKAGWMQSENVVEQTTVLNLNSGTSLVVPKTLFRTIGKLIISEYRNELNMLEKEFEDL